MIEVFSDCTFCQTLLIDYMQEYGVDWDVVWDDRGHFTEPHDGETLGLGTLAVRRYLRNNAAPVLKEAEFSSNKNLACKVTRI